MTELVEITPENYPEALALSVREDQQRFVSPVVRSLADAFVYSGADVRLIRDGGVLVGCVMIYPFEREGLRLVNIVRLLIDQNHQNRGFGREALRLTFAWLAGFEPAPDRVRISTLADNAVALHLYESVGFERAGIEDGEIALYRPLETTRNSAVL